MEPCSDRVPLTVDQIRERLAAQEEEQSKAGPPRRFGWLGLVAVGIIALGAAASLGLHYAP